jgi:hypothetical protein
LTASIYLKGGEEEDEDEAGVEVRFARMAA